MSKPFSSYFTLAEKLLWSISVLFIILSFLIFDRNNYMTLFSSLTGITSLIFCAKGNPIGQMLMVIFGSLYGIISFGFGYYGEVATYLGMTVPMAIVSLFSWLRNPFEGNRSTVKINRIKAREIPLIILLTAGVTIAFYFILGALKTENLLPSTLSVSTSFAAVYLTARRSEYYALAYALNDIVLIILWTLASFRETTYIPVVICFAAFLINDLYGYVNWKKMYRQQSKK